MPRKHGTCEQPQSRLRFAPMLLTWSTRRGETVARIFNRGRAMRVAIHRPRGTSSSCVVHVQPLELTRGTGRALCMPHVLQLDAETMPAASRAVERLLVAWGVIPDVEALR